jgi:hypothetical protein
MNQAVAASTGSAIHPLAVVVTARMVMVDSGDRRLPTISKICGSQLNPSFNQTSPANSKNTIPARRIRKAAGKSVLHRTGTTGLFIDLEGFFMATSSTASRS